MQLDSGPRNRLSLRIAYDSLQGCRLALSVQRKREEGKDENPRNYISVLKDSMNKDHRGPLL